MWKIFRSQHQAKACASGGVPFRIRFHVLSNIDRTCLLRPNIKVVAKPGKEHEQGVLFRKAVIHDCNRSGGPKQAAQQPNIEAEELLSNQEDYNCGQGAEYGVGQTDRNFVGYLMGPAKSTVPAVGGS